jgi:hypothetical protein
MRAGSRALVECEKQRGLNAHWRAFTGYIFNYGLYTG